MATSRYITGPDGALVEAPTAETVVLDSDYTTKDNLQDALDELAVSRTLPFLDRSTATGPAWFPSRAALGSGAANYGNAVEAAWWWTLNGDYRIRQDGDLIAIEVYMPGTVPAEIASVYIDIWRRGTSNSYKIWHTEDITASLTGAGTCTHTFATPLAVLEGDVIGWHFTSTAGAPSADWLTLTTGLAAKSSYYTLTDPDTTLQTTHNVAAETASTSVLPIKPIMQAPYLVAIGDSITKGTDQSNPQGSLGHQVGRVLNCVPSRNAGVAGNKIGQIATRFTTDVVDTGCRVAVIGAGVNDLKTTSDADFKAAWATVLAACQAAQIIPVVWGILPYNGGSTAHLQKRDLWNTWLETTVPTYGGVYVDCNPVVGKFRTGGDAGNLWDWETTIYSADGIHPTITGVGLIAARIASVLTWTVGGLLRCGRLGVAHGIELDGWRCEATGVERSITVGRRVRAETPGNDGEFGTHLAISAGACAIDAEHGYGGNLKLCSGVSTGWRSSHIELHTPTGNNTTSTTRNELALRLRVGHYTASPITDTHLLRALYFNDANTGTTCTSALWGTSTVLRTNQIFRADGGYQSADGTAGVSGTLVQDDGTTARLTTVVKNGLITGVTVAASSGAAVTWTPAA